jgi:methionine-rich copper-binding protein CopC
MAKSTSACRLVTACACAFLALALPASASAHATLVRCNVAPSASLSAVPKVISCTFAEGVNPKGSFIGVFQATGDKGEVDSQNSAVSFSNAKEMTVSVPKLAKGTYNLLWFTISADDGHRAGGYTPFAIR